MAKKARKKKATVKQIQPEPPSFDEMFPAIARWILQEEGWIELGADHYSNSLARALYGGGMAWEGTDDYGSLDESLRAMDKGIAAWLDENRPDGGQVEGAKKKTPPGLPSSSSRRRKSSSKPTHPKRRDRVKPDATPTVPRTVVEKVHKFVEIAEALRSGEHFQITRLTSLKGLCKDPRAARSFARFLVVQARKRADDKEATDRIKGLMDRSISGLESYLEDTTKERKERLYDLLRELEQEQDEYKKIGWGQVRVVHSMELLVVEKAMKSLLRDHEAPFWLYQAARDYCERYDPRHGTGLIPASAPMMQDIADFWRDYFGLGS
jgi:hypothetical protein